MAGNVHNWDAFISHASEDKATFVAELAKRLEGHGIRVWYNAHTLMIGDSLRRKIDEGLRQSRFAIVVLSQAFFNKHWPQHELDGLVQREMSGEGKVILPIWHEVTRDDVMSFSAPLADKVAGDSARGIDSVVQQLLLVLRPEIGNNIESASSTNSTASGPEARQPSRRSRHYLLATGSALAVAVATIALFANARRRHSPGDTFPTPTPVHPPAVMGSLSTDSWSSCSRFERCGTMG